MNRTQWERVESVFQAALERPISARKQFLDESLGTERELRAEVEALLAHHGADTDFLDKPIVDLAGKVTEVIADAERIGPYRIVRQVGAGGMGVVYLAMHEGPGFERPVALKVIRRGLDTEDVLLRFQLERRMLAALRHPNVARLLDAGATPDGRPYFVMDFVEGVPIDAYVEQQQLSLPQRLRLFQTVCGAVQHAHANLIVHRDLKPGNILVGKDGTPLLLDFGIGKVLDVAESADASTTRTGVRAFTPEYAAPEQVRGEPVSTATDVYGLGLLLFRILTGRRPFDAASAADYEKAVLEQEPARPSSFGDRRLAGDLDNIVAKALRKEPERRYASVAALSEDVQRHLDGLPVRARADTFGYRTGKFIRRHRLALAATAIVFASLIGATAYSMAQTRAVTREKDKAVEVQSFLLEMFGAVGANRADSVSVKQLLDGQTGIVPIAYADRPELRAQMEMVIAEGYQRLGLFPKAEPIAREALATRRATLPANHPDIPASVSLLGWILHEQGKSADGEKLIREALALWPRTRPYNPAGHARTLNDLGVIREQRGDNVEAERVYRQALDIRRRTFGPNHRSVAVTQSNLSIVIYSKADYKGAAAMAESALVAMRAALGPDHQRSTVIQSNLAVFKSAMGDIAGAERDYRDLVDRNTRVLGRQHPVTAQTMYNLARTMVRANKPGEAESISREALGIVEKIFGKEHTRVASSLSQLGSILSGQKRFAEARPLAERALAIQRKLRGNGHRDVADALTALANVYADGGDWPNAQRMHGEALQIFEATLPKEHVEVAAARTRYARTLFVQGKPEAALPLYQAAHESLVKSGMRPASPVLINARLRLAQTLVAVNRPAAADSIVALVPADSGVTPAMRALRDTVRSAIAAKTKAAP